MWRITKDLINDDGVVPSRVGTSGDKWGDGMFDPIQPLPSDGSLLKFRLKDDDGEVYYEGELNDDDECLNQSEALAFGTHDAGCTTIEVRRAGRWVQEIA